MSAEGLHATVPDIPLSDALLPLLDFKPGRPHPRNVATVLRPSSGIINLVLAEEGNDALYPFTILHSEWELRAGRHRIIDAWTQMLKPHSTTFFGRTNHIASFMARFPEYSSQQRAAGVNVVLSSCVVPSLDLARIIIAAVDSNQDVLLTSNGRCVGFICGDDSWQFLPTHLPHRILQSDIEEFAPQYGRRTEVNARFITGLWDTLDCISHCLTEQIPSDIEPVNEQLFRTAGVFALDSSNIYVGDTASIAPLVVLDASAGPIIIGENVTVIAHSTIIGPCYIGDGTIVKAGAKIYGNTIIGERCKVGGEIENSIIHAYSNKQHEGFLGHSYIGEWVNLGADTNTSDLKNTYGSISIKQRGVQRNTQRMFLGLLCGDHTKSGIDTMFNTGTVTGIHANVFGSGYSPVEIPSFTWGAINESRVYATKMAYSVARTVMQRRDKQLLPEELTLMNEEFERTHGG
ncbi:MAG: hypothetical protein JNL32_13040 [Candidatus Kapabacteria bacterium]|nr:hypothetical protein [Candidatus Kapabacteria bacterium]